MKKLLLTLALLFVPSFVFAENLPIDSALEVVDREYKKSDLPVGSNDDSVEMLREKITKMIVPLVKYLMIGISILYLMIVIFGLAISGGTEEKISEFKKKAGFIIFGLVMISFADQIATAFDPFVDSNSKNFGSYDRIKQIVFIAESFLTILAAGVAVFTIVFSGIKMIQSQGDENEVGEAKKNIGYAFGGLLVILLARKFVLDIFFTDWKSPSLEAAEKTNVEVMALVATMMQYLAIAGVGLVVIAGAYYLFSAGEDDNAQKAKSIVKNALIGLVLLMISYVLVSTFIPK